MNQERWQRNTPHITSEQFDNEIVVVNFESGKYHSIQGDGVAIWQWLEQLPTVDEAVALAVQRFDGDAAEIDRAVRAFFADLQREQLIVTGAAAKPSTGPQSTDLRTPFRPPALTTFSDMQELLWLDPIHEVDEAGWPIARDNAGN